MNYCSAWNVGQFTTTPAWIFPKSALVAKDGRNMTK